ncbi:unnamed protein product [Angiostrongylus costaricensis]|uniref:Cytoplasmic protein n=1 Tax=Angiostrongylus costaricensis TaxID=334426 RepID=A0A0R3PM85_ANGCS|nr:unnamed protein product [Angiostrongylus costaricensis]
MKVVVIRNQNVAAWHPEPSFPYEQTRPLLSETTEDQVWYFWLSDAKSKPVPGSTTVLLKNIFYTSKHEWFTRTREERLRSVAAPTPRKN